MSQTTEDTFKTDDRSEFQVLQRRQVRQRQKLGFTTRWWPFPELIQGGSSDAARLPSLG